MWLSRLLGVGSGRVRSDIDRAVNEVQERVSVAKRLNDVELEATSDELRRRLAMGEPSARVTLEAIARCAESARRHRGLEPRRAQLGVGIGMASGLVVEWPTGEGKTLAAAFTAAAWAVQGSGVHVLTPSPYLAQRDAAWMEPVLRGIGLSIDVVTADQPRSRKRVGYAAEVAYTTHLEVAFDLLRDGFVRAAAERVQRQADSVIVDEADSILIDEARIPMVISGPDVGAGSDPYWAASVVEQLVPGEDYATDTGRRMAWFTDGGIDRLERITGVDPFSDDYSRLIRPLMHGLRARALYLRDRDYVVRDDTICVVDEYTGRVVAGRKWADGLHQAIEAKERLPLTRPRRTYAHLTVPSLIDRYERVAGMTGTASEVVAELRTIYGLETVVLDPHVPSVRVDHPDRCFESMDQKLDAVLADIEARHATRQPLLIGCDSVVGSEQLGDRLKRLGIRHVILNARDEEQEADVIAHAGLPGAVTVATHMAGRGVDIRLGGPTFDRGAAIEAAAVGGLCVIGTERFESPRIERQMRGRSARQGEPGESIFYASLEDRIVRDWLPVGRDMKPCRRLAMAQGQLYDHNAAMRMDVLAFNRVFEHHRLAALAQRELLLDEDGKGDRLAEHDRRWIHHLNELHDLLDTIHFRAWGGEAPVAAWQRECARLLQQFVDRTGLPPVDAPLGEDAECDDADLAVWLERLGPPLAEAEAAHAADASSSHAMSVSSVQTTWGAAIMLDVVAVSDVDGTE
jgi:preprotein translocase subunit SecA